MQRRLNELFGHQLALRIGVNTGEVVVGRPREGSSFVTGDAVNVAARLEQAARPGRIWLASGQQSPSVRPSSSPRRRGSRRRANRAASCAGRSFAWSRRRDRAAPRLDTAFVGRERELAWLERELAACRNERRPRFASLVGEAGIGGTSLVREFRTRVPEGALPARPLRLVRTRRREVRWPTSSVPNSACSRGTQSRPRLPGLPAARSSASPSDSTSAATSTRAALRAPSQGVGTARDRAGGYADGRPGR